jgi:hypothetical protein
MNWVVLHTLSSVQDMKKTRSYPLAEASDPPDNEWIYWVEFAYNAVHHIDFGPRFSTRCGVLGKSAFGLGHETA